MVKGINANLRSIDSDKQIIDCPIKDSISMLMPAWPLQNTVAVNPFWNMKDHSFCDVISRLNPVFHQPLLMPISFYRSKYEKGEITNPALNAALNETRKIWQSLPKSVMDFSKLNPKKSKHHRDVTTIADIAPYQLDLPEFVASEIGRFASAYFDQNQALIDFPWKNCSFWEAWLKYQDLDKSLTLVGFRLAKKALAPLKELSSEKAIEKIMAELGLSSKVAQYLYLQRASTSVMGWGSKIRYDEWQKNLGYDTTSYSSTVDLLAARLSYDYIIFKELQLENKKLFQSWSATLNSKDLSNAKNDESLGILHTWQLASEISYQHELAAKIDLKKSATEKTHRFKLVFCIDVRSEMIRRHIEKSDISASTAGFAGFFAAAIDFKKTNEKTMGHRLPVLLKPAISISEESFLNHNGSTLIEKTIFSSYFRNLRKMHISSFLFVELFGILSFVDLFKKSLKSFFQSNDLPQRFSSVQFDIEDQCILDHQSKLPLTHEQKTAFAANALTHMGLKENFAKLNVIVGHGSETSNNAFASAYDCGACGGHAGDINAKFLVSLLNSSKIRKSLEDKSIIIPADSWFMAAVHETVTDNIHLLDETIYPDSLRADIADLKASLKRASQACRGERQFSRSDCLDTSALRRSKNWSEVRPEWGLAGNACFIVAPRYRTKNINLSSRAFLHDYDWQSDSQFKTLELIMTAPMIVTNWINLQYFSSVVAPKYFGSGNKTIHNLTNETGVVEGNGGDLRVGLPIQSVHDGIKFVHDPIRLTVIIDAPRAEIEKIVANHENVSLLLRNQWLHLFHINSETATIWQRRPDGSYVEFSEKGS